MNYRQICLENDKANELQRLERPHRLSEVGRDPSKFCFNVSACSA